MFLLLWWVDVEKQRTIHSKAKDYANGFILFERRRKVAKIEMREENASQGNFDLLRWHNNDKEKVHNNYKRHPI